jgi:hypothetical protein
MRSGPLPAFRVSGLEPRDSTDSGCDSTTRWKDPPCTHTHGITLRVHSNSALILPFATPLSAGGASYSQPAGSEQTPPALTDDGHGRAPSAGGRSIPRLPTAAGASTRRLFDGLTAPLRQIGSSFAPAPSATDPAAAATAVPMRQFHSAASWAPAAATAAGASASAPAAEGTNIVAIYSDPLKPVDVPLFSVGLSVGLSVCLSVCLSVGPAQAGPYLTV